MTPIIVNNDLCHPWSAIRKRGIKKVSETTKASFTRLYGWLEAVSKKDKTSKAHRPLITL